MDITLRFKKPVTVQINGIRYEGKEVLVKNMKVAAEIVRLAKNHYGSDILI